MRPSDIRKLAEDFGSVESIKMPTNIDGKNKGYVIISFTHAKEAKDFVEFADGLEFFGQRIEANIAKPLKEIST